MREPEEGGKLGLRVRAVAASLGTLLVLAGEESFPIPTYLGLLLILLALGWTWRIKKVPVGRLLAVLIVAWGVKCDYSRPPEPIPVPNMRGPASTVSDVKLNVGGVSLGMTREAVEALVGPGEQTPDGDVSYRDGEVVVSFFADKCYTVRGTVLFDGEKEFFKKGQPRQKIMSVLGKPQWESDGREIYDALDPDLAIRYREGKTESFELSQPLDIQLGD